MIRDVTKKTLRPETMVGLISGAHRENWEIPTYGAAKVVPSGRVKE